MICAWPPCGAVFCDDADYLPDGNGERRRHCSTLCADRDYAQRKRRRRRLRERSAPGACKAPYKRRFATREAAEAGAAGSGIALHPYLCQCGEWHLTSALAEDGDRAPGPSPWQSGQSAARA